MSLPHGNPQLVARLPREGDRVGGRYRIEEKLGMGAMGVVYRAHDEGLDRPVALKMLLPERASDPTLVIRFTREGRAAARLKSPHVCAVLDVGLDADRRLPFLVMEHLEGRDLAHLGQRMAPRDAVDLVLQACEALAEAHLAGVVHRDVKPSNLFLTRRPDGSSCLKVLDFGLSKAAAPGAAGSEEITITSALLGSPLYMAPEQMRAARDVDGRADVWSLGVVLYELVAGTVPFDGESMVGVFMSVVKKPAKPLRTARPDAPVGLESAIARALEKDPANRWPGVAELARALAPYGSAESRASAERIVRTFCLDERSDPGRARELDDDRRTRRSLKTWRLLVAMKLRLFLLRLKASREDWPWAVGFAVAGVAVFLLLMTVVNSLR